MIHHYRPRGDNEEAWDNIDLTGFLGQKMQLKPNVLCKDSVPEARRWRDGSAVLVPIDLARRAGAAHDTGR